MDKQPLSVEKMVSEITEEEYKELIRYYIVKLRHAYPYAKEKTLEKLALLCAAAEETEE